MNYIYDIVLNFQDYYYDFFEWNPKDKIKNINRIPLYHVSSEDLLILKNNQVILDNPFLNKVLDQNKNKKNINFLISNTKLTIGIQINEKGIVKKRSSLLFDEETEANSIATNLKVTKINYKQNIPFTKENKLRIEIEKKDILITYIEKETDITTLKYLYYEYFSKESENIKQIKSSLIKELQKPWNTKQNNLYTIITLLTKKINHPS